MRGASRSLRCWHRFLGSMRTYRKWVRIWQCQSCQIWIVFWVVGFILQVAGIFAWRVAGHWGSFVFHPLLSRVVLLTTWFFRTRSKNSYQMSGGLIYIQKVPVCPSFIRIRCKVFCLIDSPCSNRWDNW